MYKKVDSEIVERLRQIVGADDVLVEADDMEPYSHDEVVGLRADPEVVGGARLRRDHPLPGKDESHPGN
jgi:hypothetical protein